MKAIAWQDDLDTGIAVIDSQHRRIIELINELYAARRAGQRESVGAVLAEVVDYTVSHLAFEESLMEEAGYRFIGPHKRVHELFVRRVKALQDRFKAGEDVAEELGTMLASWLFNHIRREDADYVSAVKGSIQEIVADQHESGWLARGLKRFFG